MGPQAGIELATQVVAQTAARRDQDHIPLILYSQPNVPDRTAFLTEESAPSPALAIAEGLSTLQESGAQIAGIACNTAHAPPIFDEVQRALKERNATIKVFHLIEETVRAITTEFPSIKRVGVLGTKGTLSSRMYDDRLEKFGLIALRPPNMEGLMAAIYDPETGVKSCSSPIHPAAREQILEAIEQVEKLGAEAVILGCTELPLAVPEPSVNGLAMIDPSAMLARALVHYASPDRLREMRVPDDYS